MGLPFVEEATQRRGILTILSAFCSQGRNGTARRDTARSEAASSRRSGGSLRHRRHGSSRRSSGVAKKPLLPDNKRSYLRETDDQVSHLLVHLYKDADFRSPFRWRKQAEQLESPEKRKQFAFI